MKQFEYDKWVHAGNGEVVSSNYLVSGVSVHDHICNCEVVDGESPSAVFIAAAPEVFAALQGLLEVFDCTDGRVWTTASKRRALDAAHSAVKLALGEKE